MIFMINFHELLHRDKITYWCSMLADLDCNGELLHKDFQEDHNRLLTYQYTLGFIWGVHD